MKLSTTQRWKQLQHKPYGLRNRTLKLKIKKKRDLSGKYVILLNQKRNKYAALLKFISKTICKVKAAIVINNKIIKQISPKFIISPRKKSKKFLRKIEVIVSKRFKDEYEKLHSFAKKPSKEEMKVIPPIKIFSCTTCNHKFTSKKYFDEHQESHEQSQNNVNTSSGSESEGELMIDDDVMLVVGENSNSISPCPDFATSVKKDPNEVEAEEFCCMMQNCGKKFDTEDLLVLHIGMYHNAKTFKCNKCDNSFKREAGLIAHQRMVHPVEVIPPKMEAPKRARRQSVFFQSPVNGTTQQTSNESPVSRNVVFKPYNSSTKTKFMCRICSAKFAQRTFLDRHITVHHITKMYHCFKCGNSFTSIKLLDHLKVIHKDLVNDEKYIATISDVESISIHRCPFCRYSSRIRNQVNDHMKDEHYDEFEKSEHPEEDNASSPDSLDSLLLPESLKILNGKESKLLAAKHLKENMTKARRRANDPSFKYRCARCQRRFARPNTLHKHMCIRKEAEPSRSESPDLPAISPPPAISTSNNLNNTSKAAGRFTAKSQMVNGFFNCLLCPQVFTDRAMFTIHVSTGHLSPQNQPKSSTTHPNGFYRNIS